jgi:hypothetical protein
VDTAFVDRHLSELLTSPAPSDIVTAAAEFARTQRPSSTTVPAGQPDDPWVTLKDWGR